MKKIIFINALSIILFITCDVDGLKEKIEEPVIEKTTLTILNLPENITGESFKQIAVGNVAVCDNPAESALDGTTAVVPLVSPDGKQFAKTGVYLARLVIENPDKTLLELNDVPVEFENGYGTLDLSSIERGGEEEGQLRGLTILNLPENTINTSFKLVTIGNTAVSNDFTLIEVKNNSAVVPLELNNGNGEFKKTGIYIISLTLDVDSLTHLEITAEDKVAVEFIEGNGVLDLADYGDTFLAVRFLTILNMPDNTEIDSFQSLNIGDIAKAMMDEIEITDGTALVPITLNNGKEFNKTGTFFITLRVIIDSLNDIDITKDDFVMVKFENGNGTLDLQNLYGYLGKGYLEGDITNRTNFYEAQVKKDTRFEMNGYFYRVITQASMDNLYQYGQFPNTTLYVYAVEAESNVVDYKYISTMRNADEFIRFRLSAVKPVYNVEKCGYYNGNDRALWKFIKINGEWRWKTDIGAAFEVENQVLSVPIGNLLYKWENVDISPTQIGLPAGVYCFEIAGAKGGDSENMYVRDDSKSVSPVLGGDGGKIIELVSIGSDKQVTVYTGRAGNSSLFEALPASEHYRVGYSGVSGGGGGAGSFISYDLGQPGDYFLCAGGGAGGVGLMRAYGYDGGWTYVYRISSGGAGGSVDRGGDGGGIMEVQGLGVDYTIKEVKNVTSGSGKDGIGNVTVGKTEYKVFSSFQPIYSVINSEIKVLLTSYQSTIEIGAKPSIMEPPSSYSLSLNDFLSYMSDLPQSDSGGNNRNAVRGGNSGTGYVRIYSLN